MYWSTRLLDRLQYWSWWIEFKIHHHNTSMLMHFRSSACHKGRVTLSHLAECGLWTTFSKRFFGVVDIPMHPKMVYFAINKDKALLKGCVAMLHALLWKIKAYYINLTRHRGRTNRLRQSRLLSHTQTHSANWFICPANKDAMHSLAGLRPLSNVKFYSA